ncbi:uncharacterized protein kcnk20 [Chaetodon auriga]|uniref:uncharacterized protein kcnk20 n=1 Tax=Chaetodon auriga TaxID=39042 RepID=UPI004032E49B
MKCCAGTLHNVTHVPGKLEHEMQCCGSILQRPEDVCCMSEDKELLYSAKTGFRCCGHLYYNTSLWSCCAGQLNPVHQPGHHQNNTITESRLHSLKNLKETDLCGDMLIGTVDRVSPHSIMFSTVLKINGTTATVRALPSPHILQIQDHCNSPKLIPGKIYFFREVNFFAYFNHGSILQSLHFIISKCHRLFLIVFGVTAPSTAMGKVLLVFYGLLGCSAAILFFNLFLERVITLLSLLIFRCHRRRTRHSGLEGRASEGNRNEEWNPSVHQVTLLLFVAVLLVVCGSASLYSAMEGWIYLESLYICFVAFSTVGFGDFVSSQREHHEDTWVYQVSNCLLMLLGVCCIFSLFNAMSVIINQGLNWMLMMLAQMYHSVCHYRSQPLFKLCFSDSKHFDAEPLAEVI